MRCAKCSVDVPQPQELQIGDVFVPFEATTTHEFHIIGSDRHVIRSKGIIVRWVVCDKCAGKAHDHSWLVCLVLSMVLLLIFIAGLRGYLNFDGGRYQDLAILAIFGLPISIGATVYCSGYWLRKGPEYRSRYCRDSVLADVMDSLLKRDDFAATYGRVGPRVGQCLGRFQRSD